MLSIDRMLIAVSSLCSVNDKRVILIEITLSQSKKFHNFPNVQFACFQNGKMDFRSEWKKNNQIIDIFPTFSFAKQSSSK